MWELLTGEEPYADMHCASIIGRSNIVIKIHVLFHLQCNMFLLSLILICICFYHLIVKELVGSLLHIDLLSLSCWCVAFNF